MTFAPVLYVNNPVSGQTYYAGMGHGAIPSAGTLITCFVQAWNGPNGSGGPVAVSSITAIARNVSSATDFTHSDPGVNTESVQRTAGNSTDRWMPAGKYVGGPIGSLSIQLQYTGQAYIPAPSSFSPTQGGPGTSVGISGNNFFDAPIVRFNGLDAASFVRDSETHITAVVPNGATVGPISVINETGSGSTPGNYIPYNPPSISGFSPGVGAPGTSVTISGSGFTGTTNVDFNGTPASFTPNSDSSITAIVPNGATAGPIHVTNPAGSATSAGSFQPGQLYWGDESNNGVVHNVVAIWYGDPSNNGVPHKAAGFWVPMNPDGTGGVRRIF